MTAAASIPRRRTTGISASSRCAAAQTSSAPTYTSSARRVAAPSYASSCQRRTAAMSAELTETIRVVVVDDHGVVRQGLFAFLEGERGIEVVGDAESEDRKSTRLNSSH